MNLPSRLRSLWMLTLLSNLGLAVMPSLGNASEFGVKSVVTHGVGGAPRTHEFIAGDRVCLTSVVSGITFGPDGATDLRMGIELRDAEGEIHFSIPSTPYCVALGLGEATTHIRSFVALPSTLAAGKYKVHFTIREVTSRQELEEEIEIDVLDSATFGAIHAHMARDRTGSTPAGYAFTVGDIALVGFGIVGHTLQDGAMKVRVKATVVDEDLRALGEPSMQILTPKLELGQAYAASFAANANRAGNFRMHVELEDLHSKKKASFHVPFTVIDPLAASSQLTAESDANPAVRR